MPHLYGEFVKGGPFWRTRDHIELENGRVGIALDDDYKRVQMFPSKLPAKPDFNTRHLDKTLPVPEYLVHRMQDGSQHIYFDVEGRYDFLKQRDVIGLPQVRRGSTSKSYAEVMHAQRLTGSEIFKVSENLKHNIQQQLQREPASEETVNVLQLKHVYDFELESVTGAKRKAT
jgi:hypothetical protein